MNVMDQLTKQESNVLALVAQGKRNAQIAQELYLSIHTVESHLHRIFKKLQVSSRTEAAVYAIDSGLLPESDSMELLTTAKIETPTMRSSGEPFQLRANPE